jgi:ribonuclease BN (tRNA processing enzyme)
MIKTQTVWDFKECDPRVIFLGTGSMIPNTYRNVSGIIIEMHPNNSIVLDCG